MENKLKASELFKEVVIESQKAMIAEDYNILNRMKVLMSENEVITHKTLCEYVMMVLESSRLINIRTLISILSKYNIIESDVDLTDIENINAMLIDAVTVAVGADKEQ